MHPGLEDAEGAEIDRAWGSAGISDCRGWKEGWGLCRREEADREREGRELGRKEAEDG